MRKLFAVLSIAWLTHPAWATSSNAVAVPPPHEIRSMSPEEIQGHLTGKGMGLAKAAERHGHPGPSHVLALAEELALTPIQLQRTRELFERMEALASSVGRQIVDHERSLNALFASKSATAETVARLTAQIGQLQGSLRATHLQAHVAQSEILTSHQIALYQKLRGYDSQEIAPGHGPSKRLSRPAPGAL